MIVFDVPLWMTLSLLATGILPLVVGLVTTRLTDPALKAVLLAALAIITQLLIEVADSLQSGTAYNLGNALMLGVITFMGAVTLHYGAWKPTRVADKVADVGVTDRNQPDGDGRHEA